MGAMGGGIVGAGLGGLGGLAAGSLFNRTGAGAHNDGPATIGGILGAMGGAGLGAIGGGYAGNMMGRGANNLTGGAPEDQQEEMAADSL